MYTLTLLPRNPLAAYVSRTFMETSRCPVVEVALNIRSQEDRNMKITVLSPPPSEPECPFGCRCYGVARYAVRTASSLSKD
jgi:hypothetical protein